MKFRTFTALLSFVVLFSLFPSFTITVLANNVCGTGDYVISAYYSPVPGQSRYATGTYEGDIRLNGGGVMTASGTPVATASGPFVAAPPCMSFGTTLDIEGLGTHLVLDRGGAIKGNRLDIWMGYGDVGLKNALTWGKRTVFVAVNGNSNASLSNFTFDIGVSNLKKYQVVKDSDPFKFFRELAYGDMGEDVARLQQLLKDIGYYKFDVNGEFDNNTKLALDAFKATQPEFKNTVNDPTGKFGDTAISALKVAVVQTREKYLKDSLNRNLGRGSKGEDVKKLQEFLVGLGYLNLVSGVYDSKTVDAVVQFQLDEKIIVDSSEQGAGYFGPKTQLAFDRVYLALEKSLYASKSDTVESTTVLDTSLNLISSADMFTESLSEGSTGEQVYKLQQVLKDLNLLNIDPSGYYGPVTSNAVFKFQQRMGLVKSREDDAAGFVGPSTRNALNKFLNDRVLISSSLKDSASLNSVILASEDLVDKFSKELKYGDTGENVANLQLFLKKNGYLLSMFNTDYFGDQTLDALKRYITDNNLEYNEVVPFNSSVIEFINTQI